MCGHQKGYDPAILLKQMDRLLSNFDRELKTDDLRRKVLALVSANETLRHLGSSLIGRQYAKSGRDRILFYFRKYPHTIISGSELMVVSGINDWPRRIRELRVQFGWSIISGLTAKEIVLAEDPALANADLAAIKPSQYILLDEEQDRDAAFRWNTANEIRRKRSTPKEKILDYLLKNIGKKVTGEELRYVAKNQTEWARRLRELRVLAAGVLNSQAEMIYPGVTLNFKE
ncbi:MAG: hypothetical protein ACP5IL_13690, partial [Syntrophobacteraceae bacterium]